LRQHPPLVFKAHRLVYHSTLGLRIIKKKKKTPFTLHPKHYTLHPESYTLNPTPSKQGGVFLEAGASNGVHASNTLFFERSLGQPPTRKSTPIPKVNFEPDPKPPNPKPETPHPQTRNRMAGAAGRADSVLHFFFVTLEPRVE